MRGQHLYAKEETSEALKRNVKIRILTEKTLPETKTSLPEALLIKTSYFEHIDFRIATNASLVNMIIFDGKKMFLDVMADNTISEKPALYSNNPCITRIATSYFQQNWETAQPLKNENEKNAPYKNKTVPIPTSEARTQSLTQRLSDC